MRKIVSRLRRMSIKKQLVSILLLLTVIMVILSLSIAMNAVNSFYYQFRQNSQQMLYSVAIQVEDACTEGISLSKYPVIANVYGNTSLYQYLEGNGDTDPYRTLEVAVQEELLSQLNLNPSVFMIGITTLGGTFIYCDTENNTYQLSRCNTDSEYFEAILNGQGKVVILNQDAMEVLLPELELSGSSIICARAVMKLNHLEAIGLILCQISLDSVSAYFDANQAYDQQAVCVLDENGTMLYGEADTFSLAQLESLQDDFLTLHETIAHGMIYQFYRLSSGYTAILRTPVNNLLSQIKIEIVLILLLPVFALIVVLMARLLVNGIQSFVDDLMKVCSQIQHNDFSLIQEEDACVEKRQLITSINKMETYIQNLIEEVYEKNLKQAQTELQLIRSQINPHFVYNTLETIRAEAYIHKEYTIADMTTLLGKTLRYGISQQSNYVTLEQELFHLQEYVSLQQMRMGQKLNVMVFVPQDLRSCTIVRLTLQPLVENAIQHGFKEDVEPFTIRILGYRENGDLILTVSDNGRGMTADDLRELQDSVKGMNEDGHSIGLRNTNRRLELFFGKDYGLTIRSVLNQGTTVILRMPLKWEDS